MKHAGDMLRRHVRLNKPLFNDHYEKKGSVAMSPLVLSDKAVITNLTLKCRLNVLSNI